MRRREIGREARAQFFRRDRRVDDAGRRRDRVRGDRIPLGDHVGLGGSACGYGGQQRGAEAALRATCIFEF